MSPIGRNDPCPCGSGKKYKKCCGAAAVRTPEAEYGRIRRIDGETSNLLADFARRKYGRSALDDAWIDFGGSEKQAPDDSDPEYQYFLRWFEFNWRPSGKETLAESFLAERGTRVDQDVRHFIETTLRAPYSFFQAIEVEPGAGMRLRDVLRKKEFRVTERAASETVKESNLLFARVVEIDGLAFMMGNGSHILPAMFLGSLTDHRASLEAQRGSTSAPLPPEFFVEREEDLRELYFELAAAADDRRIDLCNAEGDPPRQGRS